MLYSETIPTGEVETIPHTLFFWRPVSPIAGGSEMGCSTSGEVSSEDQWFRSVTD